MASLQGQLLIAAPRLGDPNFYHAVILIVRHNEDGALGLVLNRPLDVTVQSAWEQISQTPCNIEGMLHQGGPCEGPLIVLHTDEEISESAVIEGVHFSSDKDAIEDLVARSGASAKFFIGYAGWSQGQLEAELEEGAWLTAPASAEVVFHSSEQQWKQLMRSVSRATPSPWLDPQSIPEDPSLN